MLAHEACGLRMRGLACADGVQVLDSVGVAEEEF